MPPAVDDEDCRKIGEFLYRRTGMVLPRHPDYIIRRVIDRMQATATTSFDQYLARLRADFDDEIEHFINAFTINETYFYREEYQLRCLTTDLLAQCIATKPSGAPVRIWSIPCSTGEEPYSIAMWLLDTWPAVDSYDVEIIGSDIDTRVLEAARAGQYGQRALMRLPKATIARYFETIDDQTWRIIADLRQSIGFSATNVVAATEVRQLGRFDVIFCRNMLIYFDDASRRIAAENLYESLVPGGFICLGHTESMSRISPLFEVQRYADAVVYQRPLDPPDV